MKHKLFQVVSNVWDVPLGEINDDSSPDNIARWDSIRHIDLLVAIEEEFSVKFDDKQIVEMMNVALILLVLEEHIQNVDI